MSEKFAEPFLRNGAASKSIHVTYGTCDVRDICPSEKISSLMQFFFSEIDLFCHK